MVHYSYEQVDFPVVGDYPWAVCEIVPIDGKVWAVLDHYPEKETFTAVPVDVATFVDLPEEIWNDRHTRRCYVPLVAANAIEFRGTVVWAAYGSPPCPY